MNAYPSRGQQLVYYIGLVKTGSTSSYYPLGLHAYDSNPPHRYPRIRQVDTSACTHEPNSGGSFIITKKSNMKFLLVVSALLAVGFAIPISEQVLDDWSVYKTAHGKVYSTAEDEARLNTFLKSKTLVEEHNALYEQGKTTYTMALNKFADMDGKQSPILSEFLVIRIRGDR
uniref:Cathepsin propeptide inhibitor domain-containing protein n=1 Tax=Timema poppense TaxID=170557 RepID=A0A7R9CTX7_TIMPO|nr:unnamed protein product [Timema poppensis]